MTNYEKYKDKIDAIFDAKSRIALNKMTGMPDDCRNFSNCVGCSFSFRYSNDADCGVTAAKWLLSEYTEPKVDWSKVPIDTPVLVSDDGVNWERRYFVRKPAKAMFCVYSNGATSWSTDSCVAWYRYAKLWEVE